METTVNPRTALKVTQRRPAEIDPMLIEQIANGADRADLGSLFWRAQVAGDRSTIRVISGALLRTFSRDSYLMTKDCLILMAAAAHADYVHVDSFAGLSEWINAVRNELITVRLEDSMFGFGDPNAPVNHFERAEKRLNALQTEVKTLITTGDTRYGKIVKAISIMGDIPLALAVAQTLHTRGDNGASKVILAATIRREHGQPEKALEILEDVLATQVNDYALNSKTGALMDLFYKTGDRTYLSVAQEAMSLSLSVVPADAKRIEYTVNAVSRVLKVTRPDLHMKALNIVHHARGEVAIIEHEIPQPMFLTTKVVDLLVGLGRRDLAELQMVKLHDPADWAHKVRLQADLEPL
jgi:hypothetical protein